VRSRCHLFESDNITIDIDSSSGLVTRRVLAALSITNTAASELSKKV